MKTLRQHLEDQSDLLLQAIAANHGLETGAPDPAALAALLTDVEYLQAVLRQAPAEALAALHLLQGSPNGLPAAVFQRRFGVIRRFGGGSLQRERPWQQPANAAEWLWYRGLLARGFVDTPTGLVDHIAIPTDLLPLLPPAETSPTPPFPAPVAAPDVWQEDGDAFLDDLLTLLLYVHQEPVWPDRHGGWSPRDWEAMTRAWRGAADPPQGGNRAALLLFLARQLGLMVTRGRRLRLESRAVAAWLAHDRFAQAQTLFTAWRTATAWNDLCLTPGLVCEPGAWRNDPLLARTRLLAWLERAEVGLAYRLDTFLDCLHEHEPDFQRPDGNYETWYIRDEQGRFLRGFDHWYAVEGALVRYLWTGPLFWLGAVALAGDAPAQRWSLTARGAAFLRGEEPASAPVPPLVVDEDFRIHIPAGASLYDRWRVARMAEWEASRPTFRYRLSRRRLQQAVAAGITPERMLAFLVQATNDALPERVRRALSRFRP